MTDIYSLKADHFVVWRPGTDSTPRLVIGVLQPGNPCTLVDSRVCDFKKHPDFPELWVLPAAGVPDLRDGGVYHYFFRIRDSNPYKEQQREIEITDPMAFSVDWRLLAPHPGQGYDDDDRDPASVIMYSQGRLLPCDAGGETPDWQNDEAALATLPPNNSCVIYELPTSWSREGEKGGKLIDVGSFRDVLSLVETTASPANFTGVAALEHRAHLQELGINALELNPPADSWVDRQWGYATSNYFSADWDLGRPFGNTWSTATTDLTRLIRGCHAHSIRFIVDMAMGFSNRCPLQNLNFSEFLVRETANPAEIDPEKGERQNWGGDLFKYAYRTHGYSPTEGVRQDIYPSREFMKAMLRHWLGFYHIDGVRIDSVKTTGSWDFIEEFSRTGRKHWRKRCAAQQLSEVSADGRFIAVGEILDDHEEPELVRQHRADGVWNDSFKRRIRHALLGLCHGGDADFSEMIRKMIDCRLLGYTDLAQVVNYLGSHDVEGYQNERLYNFLDNNDIWQKQERIQLAFVCLLTAVGIPMILAGDEFADKHDLTMLHPEKQMDAVNFERLADPWRERLFNYVARLVKLRTTHPALAGNDTEFLHQDFTDGKRVMAWLRGRRGTREQLVVVANFSSWQTDHVAGDSAEYVVPGWPPLPPGTHWREITQQRDVPEVWAGRESLYSWEGKVYVVTD